MMKRQFVFRLPPIPATPTEMKDTISQVLYENSIRRNSAMTIGTLIKISKWTPSASHLSHHPLIMDKRVCDFFRHTTEN